MESLSASVSIAAELGFLTTEARWQASLRGCWGLLGFQKVLQTSCFQMIFLFLFHQILEQEDILMTNHVFSVFLHGWFSRFSSQVEWRWTGHVWMSWVLELSYPVLLFPTAPLAPQSQSLHCACLFHQFITFLFSVHLNQYIFATEIMWNWSFLVQRRRNLSLSTDVREKKSPFFHNKCEENMTVISSNSSHPFVSGGDCSSLLLLLFQEALSADQLLCSFTPIDFQLFVLNYFLLSEINSEFCLKIYHCTGFVSFCFTSSSICIQGVPWRLLFSLLLCNCSVFLTPLIFLSLLRPFPLFYFIFSHLPPTPPSSPSCWGEDLHCPCPLLHHPPHKASRMAWIPSILTKAAFVSASFCIYFMHLILRSLGKLNSMYESPCFHEVPE